MKKSLMLATVLGAGTALCLAQSATTPQSGIPAAASGSAMQSQPDTNKPQADTGAARPSAGPAIPATLAKSVDSKKVKAGDEIDAKTSVSMSSATGEQIPEGSKIVGHVTEAKAKSKGDPESSLSFSFEKIVLKGGKELPFRAVAQAIGQGQNAAAMAFPENGGPNAPQAQNGMSGGNSPAVGAGKGSGTAGNSSASSSAPQGVAVEGQQSGRLPENATGAVGLKGMTLADASGASKVTADSKSVKLDEGTQLLLRVVSQ